MITVKDWIEKLMTYDLDAPVDFVEMRYCGGGDEWYECELDIEAYSGHVVITPRPDTEYVKGQLTKLCGG